MLLSDLLGARVREGGRPLGFVHDVRVIQDGPEVEGLGRTFSVTGVLIGPRLAGRLAVGRPEVRHPLLLKAIGRLLERRLEFVEWDSVESVEPRMVVIRARRRRGAKGKA